MSKERKTFDPAFKLEVVQMSYQRSKIKELAHELGLRPELIYRWRSEYEQQGEKSFPGNGNPKLSEEEKEIARLKRELADAQMERDILKKAVGIFSKSDGKRFSS